MLVMAAAEGCVPVGGRRVAVEPAQGRQGTGRAGLGLGLGLGPGDDWSRGWARRRVHRVVVQVQAWRESPLTERGECEGTGAGRVGMPAHSTARPSTLIQHECDGRER